MRMWMVDPKVLCTQHLLGEHLELHMIVGRIKNGNSISGYISKGLCEPHKIKDRHDELVIEMKRRGMNHKSQLEEINCSRFDFGYVDAQKNLEILRAKCEKCKELQIKNEN